MTAVLIGEWAEKNRIAESLQEFVIKNGVLGASASIIVGIATVNFLRSMSSDIIMPLLNVSLLGFLKIIHKPTWDKLSKTVFPSTQFQPLHFWHELITWVVMLITALLLLQYVLNKIVSRQQPQKEGS